MMSSDSIFNKYAEAYDSLYYDKDYEAECDFLEALFKKHAQNDINTILDIGCGTGGHAIPLAKRGYQVSGLDRSPQMIQIGKQKVKEAGLSDKISLHCTPIQAANLNEKFDAVICMFAVLSYQNTNQEVADTFSKVSQHLKPGGLFIADFWYGPAVLSDRPVERVKIIDEDTIRTIRLTHPTMHTEQNLVTVSFHLLRLQGNTVLSEVSEDHTMRYFFLPELDLFLQSAGLSTIDTCPFLSINQPIDEFSWNISLIAQATP